MNPRLRFVRTEPHPFRYSKVWFVESGTHPFSGSIGHQG